VSSAYEKALEQVAAVADGGPADPCWRVTLHFHPDRLVDGVPILERMARDGVYRSQFETGVSNGGLTAHPGGDRWRWESRMFGGAYDEGPAAGRPKYGALNFRRRRVGGSPRFGSAHFRLTAGALSRTTFCYPDSFLEPSHFGTVGRVSGLVKLAEADSADPLDDYIEAHVHGPVDIGGVGVGGDGNGAAGIGGDGVGGASVGGDGLGAAGIGGDVEALVLDPCYRSTPVEDAARRLGCPVEWHGGFVVSTATLLQNPDYRGPEYVRLGASLARDGLLTPRLIGDASRAGRHDEQALKRVWHYVARFGSPEMAPQSRLKALLVPGKTVIWDKKACPVRQLRPQGEASGAFGCRRCLGQGFV
jgi:hypothetical protein